MIASGCSDRQPGPRVREIDQAGATLLEAFARGARGARETRGRRPLRAASLTGPAARLIMAGMPAAIGPSTPDRSLGERRVDSPDPDGSSNGAAASRATVSPPEARLRDADLAEGLATAVSDASSPLFAALTGLFAFFVVFHYLDLPPRAVTPVIAHDVALVVVFAVAWRTLSHRRLAPEWSHRAGAIVCGLVLSNILLTAWLVRETFYTNYVLVLVIGVGALMLSSRWVITSLLVTCCAWAATMWPLTTPARFAHLSFTVLGACALSLSLHLARKRTHVRLLELRHVDSTRKVALERALR